MMRSRILSRLAVAGIVAAWAAASFAQGLPEFWIKPKSQSFGEIDVVTACVSGIAITDPENQIFSLDGYRSVSDESVHALMPFKDELPAEIIPMFGLGFQRASDGRLQLMISFRSKNRGHCRHVVMFPDIGQQRYSIEKAAPAGTWSAVAGRVEKRLYRAMIDECKTLPNGGRSYHNLCVPLIGPIPEYFYDGQSSQIGPPEYAVKSRVGRMVVSGNKRYVVTIVGEKILVHSESETAPPN